MADSRTYRGGFHEKALTRVGSRRPGDDPALAGGPKIRAGYAPRLSYQSDWMGSVANSTRSAVQRADRSNIFESDSLAHQSCINPDRQFPSLMIGKSYGAC